MREMLDEKIGVLEKKIVEMSNMVINAVEESLKALRDSDYKIAHDVIDGDRYINELRWKIEAEAVSLIATQQPVVSDLREIVSILNIITELERIGDYAAGIGKIVLLYGSKAGYLKPIDTIFEMELSSVEMIKKSVLAFLSKDSVLAAEVIEKDNSIDLLKNKIYKEVLNKIADSKTVIHQGIWLLWVTHNLERIADRTTNICERAIYLSTGVMHDDY